jgi:hypothetical protein
MSKYFDNKQDLFMETKMTQYGSHMITSNVKKDCKTKYINIDTRFRDEYISSNCGSNTIANYNITLPDRFTDVYSISVTNIEIPNTFYNISSNLGNNTIRITDTSMNLYILKIPDGNYSTSASLKTTMNTILSSIPTNNFNQLTYDISNNISYFKSTGSTIFNIQLDVDNTGSFNKYNFKTRLGWMLGFRYQNYTVNTTGVYSEFPPNMYSPSYLYLVIDEFSKGNQSSFICPLADSNVNKNILARITMDSKNYPYGYIIPANIRNGYLISDVRSYTGKIDIQRMNVQLVNEIGIPMNLNGGEFSFCLQLEHE